ncbi:MAG: lipoprotein [Proteobacteria bacterium]|nr:lipoprotein [Pseudomonadota bacterium]
MQIMTRRKRLLLVLCALTILTACGQKGDLYLPEGKALVGWIG